MMDIEELLLRAKAKGYYNLSILNNSVVGFYKTHTVKYENPKGLKESYFFPTTFTFENNNVIVKMLLGSVSKDFQIPDNTNIECAIDYGIVLKLVDVENQIYKHLVALQTNKIPTMINKRRSHSFIDPKVLTFIILGLSEVGFPFIQITNGDSLQEEPNYSYLEYLKEMRNDKMEVDKYIEENYKYIIIFTNLDSNQDTVVQRSNLCLEPSGYTCCWKIAKSRKIEKVILYIREDGKNRIYKADYDYREHIEKGRYKVYYKNLEFIEYTVANWKNFTNSQSPIRYINKQKGYE